MSVIRRFVIPSVLAVAVAFVAAAAAWWFFVREDNKLATNAPEIPADLRTPGADTAVADSTPTDVGATDDGVQVFRIIPERSEAAYFADEKLARLPLPSTAKGSTNQIEGEFYLTEDGTALAPGTTSVFTVDVSTITSDEGMRDNRMRGALEVDQYPIATFTATSVTGYDPAIPAGEEQTLLLTGILDLHGVEREVTWEVKARRDGDVFTALATVNFLYEDFGIPVLNIAGFVSVEEDVTLQVQIVAERVS